MTEAIYAKLTGDDICEAFAWYPEPIDAPPPHYIVVPAGSTPGDYLGKWYDRIEQTWHDEPPESEPESMP